MVHLVAFRIVDQERKGTRIRVSARRQRDLFAEVNVVGERSGRRVVAQRKVIEREGQEVRLSPYSQAEILGRRTRPFLRGPTD